MTETPTPQSIFSRRACAYWRSRHIHGRARSRPNLYAWGDCVRPIIWLVGNGRRTKKPHTFTVCGSSHRTFLFLKECVQMDALPIEKRANVLSFARAMTALEGLPAKEETEQNLLLWAKGEMEFSDFYIKRLQTYRIMEDEKYASVSKQPPIGGTTSALME